MEITTAAERPAQVPVPHDALERFGVILSVTKEWTKQLGSDSHSLCEAVAEYHAQHGNLYSRPEARALVKYYRDDPDYRSLYNFTAFTLCKTLSI
jgi:hypothetical protein